MWNKPLNTTSDMELKQLAKRFGIQNLQVVSIDEPHPNMCIINSAPSHTGGIHWTAKITTENHTALYDPFGMQPDTRIIAGCKRGRDILVSTEQQQGVNDDSCGYYCLHFLYKYWVKGWSLRDELKMLENFSNII